MSFWVSFVTVYEIIWLIIIDYSIMAMGLMVKLSFYEETHTRMHTHIHTCMYVCMHWVDKYKAKLNGRFSSQFFKDALEIIVANNVFFFDDKYFKQLNGAAMGTNVAPNYANLTIAYLEEKLFERIMDSYDNVTPNTITKNWMRYLDDSSYNGNVEEFHNLLNSLHPAAKFTMETAFHV